MKKRFNFYKQDNTWYKEDLNVQGLSPLIEYLSGDNLITIEFGWGKRFLRVDGFLTKQEENEYISDEGIYVTLEEELLEELPDKIYFKKCQ